MTPTHVHSIALSVILLALCGTAPSHAGEFRPMSAAEIEAGIIDNTITGLGRRGDCTFYDHFAKGGAAISKCGSYSDTGQWRMGADTLCIKWSRRPSEYCLSFQTDGTAYRVINPDRGPDSFPFSILPGRQGG